MPETVSRTTEARIRRWFLAIVTVSVVLIAPSSALADHNNSSSASAFLSLDSFVTHSNLGFTHTDPGEPYTCGGIPIHASAWWYIEGIGREVLVTTDGTESFDTILAVFPPAPATPTCDDDIAPGNLASELFFDTVDGGDYFILVGGCGGCPGGAQGTYDLTAVSAPPGNDDRAAAHPIPGGQRLPFDNFGSATEGDEQLSCGNAPFGATVWFKYTVPAFGNAVFSVNADTLSDPVVAVYHPDGRTQAGCEDDTPGGTLSADLGLQRLEPGTYFIQVGGYGSGFDAARGEFGLRVDFTPIIDRDGDGVGDGQDCQPTNPSVRPGIPEVINNGVDENCDGHADVDRDGDGAIARGDCDDGNAARTPGKPEIIGNRVDENCDGRADWWPLIRSTIAVSFVPFDRASQIAAFNIDRAKRGSRVVMRCTGRGCPFKRKTARIRRNRPSVSVLGTLSKRERRLPVGTRLSVRVSKAKFATRETVYRIRAGRGPRRDNFCHTPGRNPC